MGTISPQFLTKEEEGRVSIEIEAIVEGKSTKQLAKKDQEKKKMEAIVNGVYALIP